MNGMTVSGSGRVLLRLVGVCRYRRTGTPYIDVATQQLAFRLPQWNECSKIGAT